MLFRSPTSNRYKKRFVSSSFTSHYTTFFLTFLTNHLSPSPPLVWMHYSIAALAAVAFGLLSPAFAIDYSPHITSPSAGDQWASGMSYTVTWVRQSGPVGRRQHLTATLQNTTLPEGFTYEEVQKTGSILLGFLSDKSEHLGWSSWPKWMQAGPDVRDAQTGRWPSTSPCIPRALTK